MAEKSKVQNRKSFRFRYVFLVIAILLLVLALLSHSKADMSILDGGSDAMIQNWVGPAGAHIAQSLFLLLGIGVYPIVFILILSVLRPFLPFPLERKGYIGALMAVGLGITILMAMWPADFIDRAVSLGIGRSGVPSSALSGGVIGQVLAAPETSDISAGIIRRYIGTMGTMVVGLVFLLAGALFIWIQDWKIICVHLFLRTQKIRDASIAKKENPPIDKGRVIKPLLGKNRGDDENGLKDDNSEEDEALSPVTTNRKKSKATVDDSKSLFAQHRSPAASKAIDGKTSSPYTLPPLSLLEKAKDSKGENRDIIQQSSYILQETLASFNIDGEVTGTVSGPRVTRFEVSLAPGVKVQKVESISSNIAMELEAESIRVLAPIPGKNAIGVEVPNSSPSAVFIRGLMETSNWQNSNSEIPIILGKDVAGKPAILDLAKAPHLLIAGATGSGKSVCMNTLIMSLIFRFSPDELRMILVDPKVVELEMYTPLPHLITPVVNQPKKIPVALRWAVHEMEKRYRIMATVKVKNLAGFNARTIPEEPMFDTDGNLIPDKLPILVIIIDELADVMMTEAKADVETSVARIAQKGRASGIHIVIATQRPSTNIITGVIKANLPTRIAFRVGSNIDSRVILDQKGAEGLLGRGDMLFIPPGASNIERIQGAMVEDADIQKVVDFISDQVEQDFDTKVISEDEATGGESGAGKQSGSSSSGSVISASSNPLVAEMLQKYSQPGDDDLILKAMEIIFAERKASTSYLQRRLKIGYNRAAEIIDLFEERGIVSDSQQGGSKRDILVFDEIAEGK